MKDKYKRYKKSNTDIKRKENNIIVKKLAEEILKEKNRYKNWRYDPCND